MPKKTDIIIIGGGLLGLFCARNLARYSYDITLIEKNPDVCMEMSRANTAIIYPGYDPAPGSLKARLSARAIDSLPKLCRELEVDFRITGSLMISYGERGDRVIQKKYRQGVENGITGMEIISGEKVYSLEPNIRPGASSALYCTKSGTLNPWELGIAAAENIAENGVNLKQGEKVLSIRREDGLFYVKTNKDEYISRLVINCAGLFADRILGFLEKPEFMLKTTLADYIVLDDTAGDHINHIIMEEAEKKGRGATLVPTADGNILLGPSKEPGGENGVYETTHNGLQFVRESAKALFPNLPMEKTIRSFAGIRPGIEILCEGRDKDFKDLYIEYSVKNPGFITLAGIKTPGLSCCDEIGKHVSQMALDYLGNPGTNHNFISARRGIPKIARLAPEERELLIKKNPEYGKIICRCRMVSEAEIRDAVRRNPGAKSLDGVKRRTGVQMGRCQGGFCTQAILEILSQELGLGIDEILKDHPGSQMIKGGCK